MNLGKLKEREIIISLHKKGKSTREVANLLDVSKSKTAYWVKRYRETGNLEDLPHSGRPSQLNKKQIKGLKKVLLDTPPRRYGGESFGWTTKTAIQYIVENYGIKYTMRGMTKILHKFNLSLITPRSEYKKDSYAARTVYRMDFKKNSKKNIWVAPSSILTK